MHFAHLVFGKTYLVFILTSIHIKTREIHQNVIRYIFNIAKNHSSDLQMTVFQRNGRWRPFWINENHLLVHFSPFQINTVYKKINDHHRIYLC